MEPRLEKVNPKLLRNTLNTWGVGYRDTDKLIADVEELHDLRMELHKIESDLADKEQEIEQELEQLSIKHNLKKNQIRFFHSEANI